MSNFEITVQKSRQDTSEQFKASTTLYQLQFCLIKFHYCFIELIH